LISYALIEKFLTALNFLAGSDARHEYVLTTSARGGDPIQFYIEMACNGMFGTGNGLIGPPDPNRFFNLNELVC
jgi:alpha-mannosidase